MRHKLALTIALAGFAVVTALGVGMAGADPGDRARRQPAPPIATTPRPSLGADAGLLERSRRRRRRPGRPRRPRLHLPLRHQRGARSRSAAAGEAAGAPAPEAEPRASSRRDVEAGNAAASSGGGVKRNQSLGGGERARAAAGSASPSATGGGTSRQAEGADGGSQFDDGGAPTAANPTTTIATFGPAPIGVPNFVIDSFEIPPFLLPIYQACGTQYGIPWEVLASINKIETAFGTNLNVSTAGAVGWMQFLPSTWETYGVDANGDGRKDPYNPVDAICAAANYLKAAAAPGPLQRDPRLQPRRLVRAGGAALRARLRQAADRPGRLADRPDRGRPLPGRRRRPLRRRNLRPRGAEQRRRGAQAYGNAAE